MLLEVLGQFFKNYLFICLAEGICIQSQFILCIEAAGDLSAIIFLNTLLSTCLNTLLIKKVNDLHPRFLFSIESICLLIVLNFVLLKRLKKKVTREILLLVETAKLFLQEAILKKFLQCRVPTVVLDHERLYPAVWSDRFSERLGGRGRITFKGNQCSWSCVHLTWESTNTVGVAGITLDFWRTAELSGWSKHAYRNWGSVFAFYQDYQV